MFVQVLAGWPPPSVPAEPAATRLDASVRGAGRAPRPRPRLHPDRAVVGRPSPPSLAARPRGRPVDAPGHGGSAASRADLAAGAELLGRSRRPGDVRRLLDGRPARASTSRSPEPDLVERLVLISATAGIEDDAERAARRAADERARGAIERDGVAAFLDRWLAQPLFADAAARRRGLDDRRRNTAAGLASSLRLAGTGTQQPLWDAAAGAVDAGAPRRRRPRRTSSWPSPSGWRVARSRRPRSPSSPAPATPPISSSPDAFLAMLRRWLDATPAPSRPSTGAAPV